MHERFSLTFFRKRSNDNFWTIFFIIKWRRLSCKCHATHWYLHNSYVIRSNMAKTVWVIFFQPLSMLLLLVLLSLINQKWLFTFRLCFHSWRYHRHIILSILSILSGMENTTIPNIVCHKHTNVNIDNNNNKTTACIFKN